MAPSKSANICTQKREGSIAVAGLCSTQERDFSFVHLSALGDPPDHHTQGSCCVSTQLKTMRRSMPKIAKVGPPPTLPSTIIKGRVVVCVVVVCVAVLVASISAPVRATL